VAIHKDTLLDLSEFADQTLDYEQSETSLTGGIHAGSQKHWGRLVAGVEAGFSALRFNTTTQAALIPLLFRSAEVRDILILTGRLG
jgi:hypothetical protein